MDEAAVAAHEARHAAAAILLGGSVDRVSIVPDETALGRTWHTKWHVPIAEMTRDEMREAAVIGLVGYIDSGIPWPPPWPSKAAATADERLLAVLAERLDLDEQAFTRLADEAFSVACSDEFTLLEEALTKALLQHRVLGRDDLKALAASAAGARPSNYQVEASVQPLEGRGSFSVLADVYSPTRSKARIRPGSYADAIAAWQASGRHIPVKGLGGALIGQADPQALREVEAFGLYFVGTLHTEKVEATETLKAIRANRVAIETDDRLSEIRIIPSFGESPAALKAWSADRDRAAVALHDALLPADPEPVDRRDVLQVKVETGLAHPHALHEYDAMRKALQSAPTAPVDELRARADRIAAEADRRQSRPRGRS